MESNDEEKKKGKSFKSQQTAADFETAIEKTGYGKFNYLLLLIAFPCCTSSVFETTTMSLILPSAECTLSLSLGAKGMLNAVTYGGMITSAVLWGFLSDVLGRKKLMVYGYLLDGFFNILCGLSQSFIAIMIFKFITGFIMCGPFAVLMAYLSELHGLKFRSRVMLSTGVFFSIANIILPSLAWLIIPHSMFNLNIIDSYFELHTWQIFLLVCSLPSIISGIAVMIFLPESPKFLMSRGRNEEAMKVFQRIHRINNGNNSEYPIKILLNEKMNEVKLDMNEGTMTGSMKVFHGMSVGLSQMAIMFKPPHLKNACIAYTIQFCILFGLNTFRLWVVQLFAIIKEYQVEFAHDAIAIDDANLCTMIEFKVNKTEYMIEEMHHENFNSTCEPNLDGEMFFNSMLISIIQLFAYLLASFIINAIGNKNLLIFGLLISGFMSGSLYWAKNSLSTLLLSGGYISISSLSSTTVVSSVVSLFPTSTRTMTVSLLMMFGRLGAIIGNLLFPLLLSYGCFPPFSMISLTALVCSAICLLIPKTNKKPLQ
ncbi:hypothetical protein PVAND_002887 [Polypedilum vanderplanki]|uniref:Major facilitator superfamily (MFS) profile domain-containing protein n=1 Tax=Polypedilum vanderplanki TaxID=319348 RepID=A0A9J6BST4_POLVA|nr:hypothetical protein PVAND_002887 [Polypedilum vanderplanki]